MSSVGDRVDGPGCGVVPALLGHTVALTGHRRSDELASHLHMLGAEVVQGPMVHTQPVAHDDHLLRRATQAVIDEPPAYLLATTGIGVRGWINAAASWRAREALLGALADTRILARGPKVVGSLSEAGVTAWFVAESGRAAAMVARVLEHDVRGAHVAVQLPGDSMDDTVAVLEAAGARVTQVPVYEWTWPEDREPARRVLRALVAGRVSAVTFTSRPAVRHFSALAHEEGIHAEVARVLQRDVLAVCIGPTTTEAVRDLLHAEACEPSQAMLGALGPVVADELHARTHLHLRVPAGDEVIVQRRLVHGRGNTVLTSDREAALLNRLIGRPRRTVGRAEILRSVWRDEAVEPSVLDATMGRLRRRLRGTGLEIDTIAGRGYLIGGEQVACTPAPNGLTLARCSS